MKSTSHVPLAFMLLLSVVYLLSPSHVNVVQATSPLEVNSELYHSTIRQSAAKECTDPRVPWNLCPNCKLKDFNAGKNGNINFGGVNRFDIYDVDAPACKEMLRKYVEKNKNCDPIRATAYDNYYNNNNNNSNKKSSGAYKTIIYFMYSVCETCCDCIPIGAREWQYEERKKKGWLLNIRRGNCAAHVHYDTCKIWPNARNYLNLKQNVPNGGEPWCDDFRKWQNSKDSKGWLQNNNVNGLTDKMRRGMWMMMAAGRCTEKTQWLNCVKMERAQNRM